MRARGDACVSLHECKSGAGLRSRGLTRTHSPPTATSANTCGCLTSRLLLDDPSGKHYLGGGCGGTQCPSPGTPKTSQKQGHAAIRMAANVLEKLDLKVFNERCPSSPPLPSFLPSSLPSLFPSVPPSFQATGLPSRRPCKGCLGGCLRERLPI